jgi:hypothetical protein
VQLADFAASVEPRCAFPLSAGLYQRFASLNQGKEAAQADEFVEFSSWRISSPESTGVLPRVTTYLGRAPSPPGEQGRGREAISRIREGREAFPATHAMQEQTAYLIRLAYVYNRLRWSKEGLALWSRH